MSDTAHIVLIDARRGDTPKAFVPGMRLQAHLHAPSGQSIQQFAKEYSGFNIHLTIRDPSGSTYRRSMEYAANRPGLDAVGNVLVVDLIVDPQCDRASNEQQRTDLKEVIEAVDLALGKPGTYTAKVECSRGRCEIVEMPMDLSSDAALTAMRAIVAGSKNIAIAAPAGHAAVKRLLVVEAGTNREFPVMRSTTAADLLLELADGKQMKDVVPDGDLRWTFSLPSSSKTCSVTSKVQGGDRSASIPALRPQNTPPDQVAQALTIMRFLDDVLGLGRAEVPLLVQAHDHASNTLLATWTGAVTQEDLRFEDIVASLPPCILVICKPGGDHLASITPDLDINIVMQPPASGTFASKCGSMRNQIELKLHLPELDAIADVRAACPGDINLDSREAVTFMLQRDPRRVDPKDMWSDVHVFRSILKFIKKPGAYKAVLTATVGTTKLATTTITYDVSSKAAFAALTDIRAKWRSIEAHNAYMDKPGMTDAALEKELHALFKAANHDPIRLVISDHDWSVERHPVHGAILSRSLNAQIAYLDAASGEYLVETACFLQPYNEGGKWGKTRLEGWSTTPPFPIVKENIHATRPAK